MDSSSHLDKQAAQYYCLDRKQGQLCRKIYLLGMSSMLQDLQLSTYLLNILKVLIGKWAHIHLQLVTK